MKADSYNRGFALGSASANFTIPEFWLILLHFLCGCFQCDKDPTEHGMKICIGFTMRSGCQLCIAQK